MAFYQIKQGTPGQREEVKRSLVGLAELSTELQEKVVTAWVTAWQNSTFDGLSDVPFSLNTPKRQLMEHVVEVTRTGMALARVGMELWGEQWSKQFDWSELVQSLILHDLDKPMLYAIQDKRLGYSEIAPRIPHGTLTAMILNELGFSSAVVSAVATHSPQCWLQPPSAICLILHYADLFSADHTYLEAGVQAHYQKSHG